MKAIRVLLLVALSWLALPSPVLAFYNPSTGRWLNRDPLGEFAGENAYAFVLNNAILSVDVDGRLQIVLLKEASITKCGGWEKAEWNYVLDVHAFDVYLIQKVDVEEQFHLFCRTKNLVYHKHEIWFEAKKYAAPPQGQQWSLTDHDEKPGHGTDTFGNHSVTVEAKIINAKDHPEIEKWPTDNPVAPGMHVLKVDNLSWWDSVTALETGSRSSSRTWSCCCSLYEGPWKHSP